MIIQCPTCSARFRLDEAKIKGRGARVRCRRCGESIVVIKPETSPAPSPVETGGDLLDLRSVVRETLGEQPAPSIPPAAPPPEQPEPEPRADFSPIARGPIEEPASSFVETAPPPPSPAEEPAPSFAETVPAAAPSSVEEPPPEKDEVDIAFEKFLSSSGLEEPLPAGEKGEVPGPGDLTVDFSPEEKLELPKEAPAPETPFRSEFLLSDTDSLAFLKEEYERGDKREAFDISTSVTAEPQLLRAEEEAAEAPKPAAVLIPPAEPASAPGEPPGRQAEPGQPGQAEAKPLAPPEEAPAAKAYLRQKPPVEAPARSSFLRPSVITLVLIFAALAGGGAYLGFTKSGQDLLRGLIPGMESLWLRGGKPGPQYDVRNLIGYYESSAKAGNLFIIKGQVANVGRTRKSGIRIHAALLDGNDRPIAERTCYAGNILPGETLRVAPREKIEEAMSNRFGEKLVNMDIAPGKSVPFMVVFFNIPEGIDAYRLEAKDGE